MRIYRYNIYLIIIKKNIKKKNGHFEKSETHGFCRNPRMRRRQPAPYWMGCKSDGPVRMYAIRQTLTHANLKG